ncbi:MAG: Grx4 family monothiol glutaredoxin [Candidatus Omnitrophica bacterium]|nr:Grx4 family monothiol glutaredoxin [Candidatus Omnitrophota bacterium]
MSQDVINRIKSEIEGNKIIVFMKGTPDAPQCGFSAATVGILKNFPYKFKAIDILANPDIRAALPEYSQWPTFPQIFVDGKLIGGCDIMHELRDSGELEKILKDAFEKK